MFNAHKYFIEKVGFLFNGMLIVCSDDKIIRIYENENLLAQIEGSPGQIYPHPSKLIWAIVNSTIIFYELKLGGKDDIEIIYDQEENMGELFQVGNNFWKEEIKIVKISEIQLLCPVNDCIFSNNGNYFVTSDDRGYLTTYSIFSNSVDIPKCQFFNFDFDSKKGEIFSEIAQEEKSKNYDLKNQEI